MHFPPRSANEGILLILAFFTIFFALMTVACASASLYLRKVMRERAQGKPSGQWLLNGIRILNKWGLCRFYGFYTTLTDDQMFSYLYKTSSALGVLFLAAFVGTLILTLVLHQAMR